MDAITGWKNRLRTLARPKSRILARLSLGPKDIGGLDVAVDDALGMCGVQTVSNVSSKRRHGFVV
jgi:hypothetical protein